MQSYSFQEGDCVYTSYGAGVVVKVDFVSHDQATCNDPQQQAINNEYRYLVRLWRIPNHSIGSSSKAYLQASAVCCTNI